MSITDNNTHGLWRGFMPHRNKIKSRLSEDLISLKLYPDNFDFNPDSEFEKWALAEVADYDNIPENMEIFDLQGGLYAIFDYKGLNTDDRIFRYIFETWLPKSDYILDNRPHFELLGAKYRNNDPESEEKIYIPIKPRER